MKRFLDRNVVNTAGVRHSWPDRLKANLDSTPHRPPRRVPCSAPAHIILEYAEDHQGPRAWRASPCQVGRQQVVPSVT